MLKTINNTKRTQDIKNLGKNIRKYRLALGLTRANLAEMLDITERVVYDYEDGLKKPRLEKVLVLAHIFSVSLDSLFSE